MEHYSYPDAIMGESGYEPVSLAAPSQTYRIDESGLYVQQESKTKIGFVANQLNLDSVRRTHQGFIFDHHDLRVKILREENRFDVAIEGWLSRLSLMFDDQLGEDLIEYSTYYSRDRQEYPFVTYTWDEWIDLRELNSTKH